MACILAWCVESLESLAQHLCRKQKQYEPKEIFLPQDLMTLRTLEDMVAEGCLSIALRVGKWGMLTDLLLEFCRLSVEEWELECPMTVENGRFGGERKSCWSFGIGDGGRQLLLSIHSHQLRRIGVLTSNTVPLLSPNLVTDMIDNLSYLQIRGTADPLSTKNPTLTYKSNKPVNEQLLSEKESIITIWLAWINKAQLGGYFLGVLGSIMCITSTATGCWRKWHVESKDGMYPGVLWVGIWKACYLHSTHPENRYIRCEEFTEDLMMLPKEIFLAQDLMTLSCIVGAVAITIMTFALGIVVKDTGHTQKLFILFSAGGLLNFVAGIMVLIPIFWNLHSILENRDIRFPVFFKMPTVPKHQEVGPAIYVGYSAAVLFLASGVMIICNRSVLQVHAESDSPQADVSLSNQFSTNFGSSVIINVINRDKPDFSDDELTSIYHVDINKGSSQSIQPLDNSKKIPVIAVTPCQ